MKITPIALALLTSSFLINASVAETVYRAKVEFKYKELNYDVTTKKFVEGAGELTGYALLQSKKDGSYTSHQDAYRWYNDGDGLGGTFFSSIWQVIDSEITITNTNFNAGVHSGINVSFHNTNLKFADGQQSITYTGKQEKQRDNGFGMPFHITKSDMLVYDKRRYQIYTNNGENACAGSSPMIGCITDELTFDRLSLQSITFNKAYEVQPVPVPAAAWLFGSAILGLSTIRKKK